MAYVHVAHDCHVGSDTIFGPARRSAATCRSRTSPRSAPTPACISSAASAGTRSSAAIRWSPRTRCRLPRRSAPRRAASTALNTIGLMRRGFIEATRVDQAEARLSLPAAVEAEHDARRCADRAAIRRSPVPKSSYLVHFIRTALARRRSCRRGRKLTTKIAVRQKTNEARPDRGQRAVSRFSSSTRPARSATTSPSSPSRTRRSPSSRRAAATAPAAAVHWVSLGHLGTCLDILKRAGVHAGGDGRSGQAHQDLRRRHSRPDDAVGLQAAALAQHRRA